MTDQLEAENPNVTKIMRTDVPTLGPNDTVAVAAKLLATTGLPAVPVIENGTMIGIVTESDIITREADVDVPTPIPFLDAIVMADAGPDFDDELRKVVAVTARQLMTAPVISIRDRASLSDVATVMIDREVNTLPVVSEDDGLVGIITRSDLVRVISSLENADSGG